MESMGRSLRKPVAAPGGIGEEREQFHVGEEANPLRVQDEVGSMTSIDFPTELLEEIFRIFSNGDFASYTDNPLLACSQVSHHWRAVALPLLWSNFNPQNHSIQALRALTSSLTASRLNHDGNVCDYASFVRTVYLGAWKLHSIPSHELHEVVTQTVEVLRLFSSHQLRKVVIYSPGTCSSWLSFHETVGPIFTTLASKITNITCLEIKGIHGYSDLITNLVQHLPFSLEILTFESILPRIYHGFSTKTQTAILDRISILPSIRHLTITDATILAIPVSEALQLWGSKIFTIRFLNCPKLNDDRIIAALATSCFNLTRLELKLKCTYQNTTAITDATMQRLVDACTLLEHLSCTDILGISDEFLKYCAAHKRRLRTIELVRCQVTGKGVRDVSGWARMELIKLTDLSRSAAADLWWVLLRGCRALLLAKLGDTIYPQGYPPSLSFDNIARDILKYK